MKLFGTSLAAAPTLVAALAAATLLVASGPSDAQLVSIPSHTHDGVVAAPDGNHTTAYETEGLPANDGSLRFRGLDDLSPLTDDEVAFLRAAIKDSFNEVYEVFAVDAIVGNVTVSSQNHNGTNAVATAQDNDQDNAPKNGLRGSGRKLPYVWDPYLQKEIFLPWCYYEYDGDTMLDVRYTNCVFDVRHYNRGISCRFCDGNDEELPPLGVKHTQKPTKKPTPMPTPPDIPDGYGTGYRFYDGDDELPPPGVKHTQKPTRKPTKKPTKLPDGYGIGYRFYAGDDELLPLGFEPTQKPTDQPTHQPTMEGPKIALPPPRVGHGRHKNGKRRQRKHRSYNQKWKGHIRRGLEQVYEEAIAEQILVKLQASGLKRLEGIVSVEFGASGDGEAQ